MRKIILRGLLLIFLLLIAIGFNYFTKLAPLGSSYAAKALCSCTFLSDREPANIFEEELGAPGYLNYSVDKAEKSVTADVYGFYERKAIYRPGLGCTLVLGMSENEVRQAVAANALVPVFPTRHMAWPTGDSMGTFLPPPEIDLPKLNKTLDWAFDDPDPEQMKRTRGVVILYKGGLIAERYAPGFTADTPQMGWSMGKSVTQALAGILVQQRKLDIKAPAPIDAWKGKDDPRSAITTDQLLRMSSGLKFDETYSLFTDVTTMLFGKPDAGVFAASQLLEYPVDTHWAYASGTTNIIQKIIKNKLGGGHQNYVNFPRQALFNRIGMTSMVMEVDASGHFVGSSFDYATPRDWARFGLLYLNDGVWEGERILPEGWVEYAYTPTPTDPTGGYGAHFWLNSKEEKFPSLPNDLYRAAGFEGQSVTIIPSRDLVIVRLGMTANRGDWDYERFVREVLESVR